MTQLQAQAYQIIDQLSEEQLSTVVAALRMWISKAQPQTPRDVDTAADHERRQRAFDELEKIRKEIASLSIDFKDFNTELAEALAEKFGTF